MKLSEKLHSIIPVLLLSMFCGTSVYSSGLAKKKQVCSAVKAFYVKHLRLPASDISIEYTDLDKFAEVAAFSSIKVLPSRNRIKPGIQVLRIGLYNGEHMLEEIQLKVRIRTYQTVIVAAERLQRHQVIGGQDLLTERRETSLIRKQFFLSKDPVCGQRTKRLLNKGEILYGDAVETVPLIERGKRVELRFHKGQIEIALPGVARQDGRHGDKIEVKCVDTKKLFKGFVQDSKTVIVNL
jgi:flagella basal body P-ring formation protein FlgA